MAGIGINNEWATYSSSATGKQEALIQACLQRRSKYTQAFEAIG
nr:hypothetical protein [Brevibacillus laterosporus]